LVETWTAGAWTLRGGYRYEQQRIEDLSLQRFGFTREAEASSQSLALGLTWRDYQRWGFDEIALTANASRIERLPSETERYAFWSNAAIQRFIIGADNTGTPLEVERSNDTTTKASSFCRTSKASATWRNTWPKTQFSGAGRPN